MMILLCNPMRKFGHSAILPFLPFYHSPLPVEPESAGSRASNELLGTDLLGIISHRSKLEEEEI